MKTPLIVAVSAFAVMLASAQPDSVQQSPKPLVEGGIYDKPFITRLGGKTVLGGYMDVAGRFERVSGVNEGWSFEARRFNLFTYSVLTRGVVVTSEIEIEHGGEEIRLEYGLVDIEFHESLSLRGGVILSPLGKTNLVHDSPKLELVERPLMATEIIPSTLSEAGIGFFGALYPSGNSRLTYELYAVNGFTADIIEDSPETRIAAGKNKLFGEDNNGEPALVGRLGFSPFLGTEAGFSFHSGAYNVFSADGLAIDDRRSLTILAADADHMMDWLRFQGEFVVAFIDIPSSLRGIFSERQHGWYLQTDIAFGREVISRWPRSVFTATARFDLVDFDSDAKGDDHQRLTLGLNFRFIQDVVLKFNYELNWLADRENVVTRSMGFRVSLASYF
ncbi:MAG TPA: hypothetical protein VGA55_05250 [Bacteroidota bacterium]